METQDLVVGGGPAGYVGAIKLAQLGRKVLLVEKDKLGGECLNYGCIPSKALIHQAGLRHKIQKAQPAGLEIDGLRSDGRKLQLWKGAVLAGLNRGIQALTKGHGVTVLQGTVRFTGNGQAQVSGTDGQAQTLSFENALICTGSRPLDIPGFAMDGTSVLGSSHALDLENPPARLVIIGGGVIGLEIGTFLAKLGSKIQVVEFTSQLLPGVEPDLVMPVKRRLERLGVEIFLGSKAVSYSGAAGSLRVKIETPEGPKELEADNILLSVGRAPNTAGLGLDGLGVTLDQRGNIQIDGHGRTNIGNIYAAGDVTGAPFLAHKASAQALRAAQAMAGSPEAADLAAIPAAIFTDPEIAFVGLSEEEARSKAGEVMIGRFPFSASGRAQTCSETDGFVKVIADRASHAVMGVGIVGPEASDLIGEAALALRLKARLEDLAETIHPHPTLSEALQEAAAAALGHAIHVMAPRAR